MKNTKESILGVCLTHLAKGADIATIIAYLGCLQETWKDDPDLLRWLAEQRQHLSKIEREENGKKT